MISVNSSWYHLHIACGVLWLLFSSCGSSGADTDASRPELDTAHTSRNAPDWAGIYTGITPCADCEGIQTALSLHTDLTFTLTTVYLGKSDDAFVVHGTFSWDTSGSRITLEGLDNRPGTYAVGEETVTQHDMDGNPIEGPLASRYILRKKTD